MTTTQTFDYLPTRMCVLLAVLDVETLQDDLQSSSISSSSPSDEGESPSLHDSLGASMLQMLARAATFLTSPTPANAPLACDHGQLTDISDHPVTAAAAPSGTASGDREGDARRGGDVFFVFCLASGSPGASADGARAKRGSDAVYDALNRQFNQLQVIDVVRVTMIISLLYVWVNSIFFFIILPSKYHDTLLPSTRSS